MQIRRHHLALVSHRPIPWGPDDGGEGDDAGDAGSQGSGEQGQSGGDRGTPLTEEGFERILNSRLAPIEQEVQRFGNFRGQVSRHLNIGQRGRDEGDGGDGDGDRGGKGEGGKGKGLSDAEKRANAAEKRLADLEKRAERSQTRAELREALDAHDKTLVKGARAQIESNLRDLRVVDGQTMLDTGTELISLDDAVKAQVANPLFLKASTKKPGGGNDGEADDSRTGGPKGFEDMDLDSMSDDDFGKLEGSLEEGWRRPPQD